jgi:transposase InsO family protein
MDVKPSHGMMCFLPDSIPSRRQVFLAEHSLGCGARRPLPWTPSARAQADAALTAHIRAIHARSRGTYGRGAPVAVAQRRPTQVMHHSDQGCQYTSIAFGLRCREAGVRPSMGSVGDAYDNALCQSFFASLECELLDRRPFATQVEARLAIFE